MPLPTSLLVAKLVGPLLVVVGLVALVNPRMLDEMFRDFVANRALIFGSGVLALLGGLAIVAVHNLWILGWPVIITVLGWLMVAGGILRIAFPNLLESIGQAMLARRTMLRLLSAAQLVLGVFLTYVGYG